MRYRCPHCQQLTISLWAKWLSGNVRIACCPDCGGFSQVRTSTARQCGAAALTVAGLTVLGFALGRWHPAWLGLGLLGSLAVYTLAWHLATLQPKDVGGWKLGQELISMFLLAFLLAAWWLGRFCSASSSLTACGQPLATRCGLGASTSTRAAAIVATLTVLTAHGGRGVQPTLQVGRFMGTPFSGLLYQWVACWMRLSVQPSC